MPAYKRSDPVKLRKDREAIVQDLESRQAPDAEDTGSKMARQKKFGSPPVTEGSVVAGPNKAKVSMPTRRGAKVIGIAKNDIS